MSLFFRGSLTARPARGSWLYRPAKTSSTWTDESSTGPRRGKFSDSMITGALLERTLGMAATVRNLTAVRKLAPKYPPPR